MELSRSLLPDFIARQYLQGRFSGRFTARTLFIDLSGFTSLTETLMKEGPVGAEKLGGILNDIFAPLVQIIYEEGGFIPYFAGDAFTAIFPEEEYSMEHCLRAALRIRRFFHQRNCRFDRFEIGYKMGLGMGEVAWGIVGGKLKSWYFRGPAIEQCVHCQAKAGNRQMVLPAAFLTRPAPSFSFTPLPAEKDACLLLQAGEQLPELPTPENNCLPEDKFERAAPHFLLQGLRNMHREGEFRSVVSVFCAFRLRSRQAFRLRSSALRAQPRSKPFRLRSSALRAQPRSKPFRQMDEHEQLDAFASVFLRRIRHFGGYFKEIDYGDKGGLMLAFFGAPVTYENNLQRALEFALTVREDWGATFGQNPFRMGITNGIAFTGFIGGRERCQYAAVGRHVNLAARLMTEAPWGSILTDEEISKNKQFSFSYRGDISYKGIAQPVPTFELTGREGTEDFPFEGPLIGREQELNRILQFARKCWKEQRGGMVALLGEAGSGKSRLAWEVCKNLEGNAEAVWLYGPADSILQKPFYPFVQLLRRFFGLKAGMDTAQQSRRFSTGFRQMMEQIENASAKNELQRLKPAFTALLELPQTDARWDKLDARSRHESILSALQTFFSALAEQGPCIIELDDLQRMDPESEDFLKQLIPLLKKSPVLLLLSARYEEEGKPPAILAQSFPLPVENIVLRNLSREAMRSFAESKLEGPITEEFLNLLERTTNGNPFYLEQLIEYFRESRLLVKEKDDSWNILDQNVRLSHSIHAILTARLDRLSSMVRETVKAAAVIGREFELPVLAEVMRRHGGFEEEVLSNTLREQVSTAEKVQIWRAVNELRYIFKHSLLREAVYEMQLHARLRQLHLLIADAIEQIHQQEITQYFADLTYHYEQAGDLVKAAHYARLAADDFRARYQNRQALIYYDKLLQWVNPDKAFKTYFNLLMRKAEMLELLGRWKESENICRKAVELTSPSSASELLKARAANALGKLLMLQGKYGESGKYLFQAQQLFERIDDLYGKVRAYGNLGNLYFRQGAYEEAKSYFIKSIELSRKGAYTSGMAQVVANLGLAFMNQGRYAEGIQWMEEQLAISEREDDRQGMATLHVNLGIILFEKGDYEQAKMHYERGLALAEELSNKFLMAIALGSLGSVYQKQGKYKEARALYLRDLKLVEEMGDKQGQAITLLYMGELESLTGAYEEAITHLQQSLEICRSLNYQKGIARAINTLGDVHYYRAEYEQALQAYDEAIQIARDISNLLVLSSSLYEKALTLQQMNRIEEALAAAEEGKEIAEQLNQEELTKDLKKLITDLKKQARFKAGEKAVLFLIPTPLGEGGSAALTREIQAVLPGIRHFIVERTRTARRFIKSVLPDADISALCFFELDKHHPQAVPADFLQPLLEGHSMGLLSEAGCPAVADPGAVVVRKAHELGITVKPLSGPSSILLALMASGLNGQSFVFHGYLPVKKEERSKKLRELERKSKQTGQTQIFIETPYRNQQLFEALLKNLQDDTLLCIAQNLSLPDERIQTYRIGVWRQRSSPFSGKQPAVFVLGRF